MLKSKLKYISDSKALKCYPDVMYYECNEKHNYEKLNKLKN